MGPGFKSQRGYLYRCGGMVDTPVLGTGAEMREGSSPFIGTTLIFDYYGKQIFN